MVYSEGKSQFTITKVYTIIIVIIELSSLSCLTCHMNWIDFIQTSIKKRKEKQMAL